MSDIREAERLTLEASDRNKNTRSDVMNDNKPGDTLIVVDPQYDFMGTADGAPYTSGSNVAALPVKGAVADMERLAGHIDRQGAKIAKIIVTLDTHEVDAQPDIGHPEFWRDADGHMPAPFTLITHDEVVARKWRPHKVSLWSRVFAYFNKVGSQMVWPRHCIDRTWGHQVFGPLQVALDMWERKTGNKVMYVRKGMNPLTEQYGVFEAAVPDPDDVSTQFNRDLLKLLTDSPRVFVAGEALDYCVKASVEQAAARLHLEQAKKFRLLVDCMSPVNVDGKNTVGLAFLTNMQKRGMKVESAA